MNYQNQTGIKSWAEDDRPREKLLTKGRQSLSDAELIAILISSGTKSLSAVDLSKKILEQASNNLLELSKLSVNELMDFPGIGEAKAVSIAAALELGRRRREAEALLKPRVTSSKDVFENVQYFLSDIHYESFLLVLLNRANKVIKKIPVSEGGVSGTVADPKKIFQIALENRASSIILCHNHPSGNIQPSEADKKLTMKLKQAGQFLDLPILDHLIIGEENYFSFADEGIL